MARIKCDTPVTILYIFYIKMEMNDAVWVLAAVFSGLSSYYYARRHPNAGSSRPLFDDVIPLQDTSKIRQLK